METNHVDFNTPQWMRDLKMRKKCKKLEKQLSSGGIQPSGLEQHNLAAESSGSSAAVSCVDARESVVGKCNIHLIPHTQNSAKMVQERAWTEIQQYADVENGKKKDSDSEDSSEDLQYGPGIVNRLKNRYLSLTLREVNTKSRPSILHMRKATSLEHLLDEEEPVDETPKSQDNRLFKSRTNGHTSNNGISSKRYTKNSSKAPEMKRARSVEAISRSDTIELKTENAKPKRESYHEDMLILKAEGNDMPWKADNKVVENTKVIPHRINKPLMIPRIMNEREKPPADVVKQTMKKFEPAKQRSKQPQLTGEVAAKVELFNFNQPTKKPPIKQKPTVAATEVKKIPNSLPLSKQTPTEAINWKTKPKSPDVTSLPSPIPDVSRTNDTDKLEIVDKPISNLSETPDLIIHSSPLRKSHKTTEEFIKAEQDFANVANNAHNVKTNGTKEPPHRPVREIKGTKVESPTKVKSPASPRNGLDELDEVKKVKSSPVSTPLHIPLQLELGSQKPPESSKIISPKSPDLNNTSLLLQKTKISDSSPSEVKNKSISDKSEQSAGNVPVENNFIFEVSPKPSLSEQETKKNLINKQKSEKSKTVTSPTKSGDISPIPAARSTSINEVPKKVEVPKPKPRSPREQDNSMLFDFTKRGGGVPDYIQNVGHISVGKMERPKAGDGGVTLLPGVIFDDAFEDDWQKSLEGPPSPCDVTFINDNILIDGKSSLSQKSVKRNTPKNKIKFVEAVPQIFEYPSEASLLDDVPSPPPAPTASSLGNVLPPLSGSSLATYTPKTGLTYDDFQLGVTRSLPAVPTPTKQEPQEDSDELVLKEVDNPVVFSAGTNSDILF